MSEHECYGAMGHDDDRTGTVEMVWAHCKNG